MFKTHEWGLLSQDNRNALIKLSLKIKKESQNQMKFNVKAHLNYFDDENEREWQHGGHHEQRQPGEEMGEQTGPLLAGCRRENDVIKYSCLSNDIIGKIFQPKSP